MIYDSSTAIPDVSAAEYHAIKARFRELAGVQDLLGAERAALAAEIRRREADVAARMRLGALSEQDRVVYRELLRA